MDTIISTQPIFSRISSYCKDHALIAPEDIVVVGFSGGPDSLFLLHALTHIHPKQQIIAAHLDHEWRSTSKQEAEWCKNTAKELGIHCVIGTLRTYTPLIKKRGSLEDIGRQARRLFLKEVASSCSAQSIAVAHHADDQLETFFIRLIRGAGAQGLAGMYPRKGLFIRPLLSLTKSEIVSYLKEYSISYLIDPSNQSSDYLRNRIRHTLLPALHSCDNRAINNALKAIEHLQDSDTYLDKLATKELGSLLDTTGALSLTQFKECDPILRHRILVKWLIFYAIPFNPSQRFFSELERFLFHKKAAGTHTIVPQWTLVKKHNRAKLIHSA